MTKTRPFAVLMSWALLSAQGVGTPWLPNLLAEEAGEAVAPNLATLNDVQVRGETITLRTSAPVRYNTFWLSDPRRLVVDLLNTELNWRKKALTVDGPVIQQVRSGQFQDKPARIARVVILLSQPIDYTTESSDNRIVITLQGKTSASPIKPDAVSAVSAQEPPVVTSTAPPVSPVITSQGKSEMVPSVPVDVAPSTPAVVAATAGASTKETPNASSPVPSTVAQQSGTVPASTPAVTATTPLVSTQTTVIASNAPAPSLQTKEAERPAGDSKKRLVLPTSPVTLDFVDADVRDVLQVLSVKSGINIVYGSDVTGTVTVHLENVPFDQAFQTVLTLRGLVAAPAGDNILRVITSAALTAERSQAVTFTKVFPLRYAKGTDLKTELDAIRTAEGRKGTITIDQTTASLVVTDTPEGLQQAERQIRDLDRPPSQVAIEAKIIEVALTKGLDLGIDWGYARTSSKQGNTITVGGSDAPTGTPGAGVTAPSGATGRIALPAGTNPGSPGTITTGLLQGAGVSGTLGGVMSFGVIGASSQLDVVLKALLKKTHTKVLSNPRIITLNNQEAKILVGDRIPYLLTTSVPGSGQNQTTQFVEVGVKLTVTPTINVDKRITLKIRPEVSSPKPTGQGLPPTVSTREAETVIMVRTGETVVIGGLIKEQTDKTTSQVPLLGDIPILGQLFKTSSDSKQRSELLVFVTPTVIED